MKKLILITISAACLMTSCRKATCRKDAEEIQDSWGDFINKEADIVNDENSLIWIGQVPNEQIISASKEAIYLRTIYYLNQLKELETQKGCSSIQIEKLMGQSISGEIQIITAWIKRMSEGDFRDVGID